MSDSRRRGYVLVGAAAALIALSGIVGMQCAGGRESADGTDPVATTGSASTTTVREPVTSTTASATTTTASSTIGSVAPELASLIRPIVDPTVCEPISATGGAPSGLPRDTSSNLPLTLFAQPSEFPVPIQIIGDPVDGQAKPFALLQRFLDREQQWMSPESSESINGIEVFVGTYDNGNGQAAWTLPDGSAAYLRSRGLDREQLIAIVSRLTPRPADAPVPGFDYGSDAPDDLQLIAEGLNTDPRETSYAGSQCRVASTGYVYRVGAFTGTPIVTYAAVIDRPPPVDVGVVGDSVILISGVEDPLAPTVDDVVDADEESWRDLLLAPETEFDQPQPIGGDWEVVFELVPIDDTATSISSLILRIEVSEGVASFVVDKRTSVVADAAEYWKIEIDGRIRSRTTAVPGPGQGVGGLTLGPVSADPERSTEFTARISTTDGDDQTIQTTGEIRLVATP